MQKSSKAKKTKWAQCGRQRKEWVKHRMHSPDGSYVGGSCQRRELTGGGR